MNKFYLYVIFINILTFIVFWLDKQKAIHKKRRIPASVLTILALWGGSLGAFFAMHIHRHKTRNPWFLFGIPIILVAHILIYILIHI